jgi:hypothetical protein
MKRLMFAVILVALLTSSLLIAVHFLDEKDNPEFLVGVEFAYSDNVNMLKALVDEVKNYTNLFVIGSVELTFNETALNEACDYIIDSDLSLIVLLTDSDLYSYNTFTWLAEAKKKHGEKFLGVYRYDEPGGNQLDKGPSMLIKDGGTYAEVAANYTSNLKIIVDYYRNYIDRVFTADYGLYWFNYQSSYSAVFAEFGWNHSRPLNVALCRGAAAAHNLEWGAIVTWTYTEYPYLESGEELYSDLELAYKAGAKYALVFSYPQNGTYGTLEEEHFNALRRFWNYSRNTPKEHGSESARVAYVVPENYGFGFRSAGDTIWGLFEADDLSAKIWSDANILVTKYGYGLDLIYYDSEGVDDLRRRYQTLFLWNETIK